MSSASTKPIQKLFLKSSVRGLQCHDNIIGIKGLFLLQFYHLGAQCCLLLTGKVDFKTLNPTEIQWLLFTLYRTIMENSHDYFMMTSHLAEKQCSV